jgi:hypothetical protein
MNVHVSQSATRCLTLQEARKEYKDKHLRYRLDDGDKCWGINLPRRSRDVEYEPKRKIKERVEEIIKVVAVAPQRKKVEPTPPPPTDLFPPNFAPPMPPSKPQEPVYATTEPEGVIYSTFGTGVEMPLIWPPNVLSDADTARMGLGFIVIGVSVLAFGLATLFVKGD